MVINLNFYCSSPFTTPNSKINWSESDVCLLLPLACCAVKCIGAQSRPTLCNPMDCGTPGSSVPGDSPGRNTGVGCHALLQGIFPILGSNPGLWHCRQILYHLSHQGSPLPCLVPCNECYSFLHRDLVFVTGFAV